MAPTTVREPRAVLDVHLADSLVALELDGIRQARRIGDLGSGAGLPGVPLAAALPEATVWLIESNRRKAAFLRRVTEECGFDNVEVVAARAEDWDGGLGLCDLVTARALAPLAVVAEWAAPLLRVGGRLVAWRGKREPRAEADAAVAAAILGLSVEEVRRVIPFAGAADHHLHVMSKVSPTPERFPRRPGIARKRPLGADGRIGSDRPER
jgi:16S rRNA (guanine527-N7)-methyltransferase